MDDDRELRAEHRALKERTAQLGREHRALQEQQPFDGGAHILHRAKLTQQIAELRAHRARLETIRFSRRDSV